MGTPKKRIIITGSNGLLGNALCNHFKNNYFVIGLSHQECDITDKKQVEDKIISEKPAIIINAAALTNVDFCEENPNKAKDVNIRGVKNLVYACKETGCLMVHISTDYVFDGKKKTPYIERDYSKPISIYAKTKLEAEKIIRVNLKKYFIIRTSWLFGKKGKDFVDTIINRLNEGIPLKIVNNKFSIPTYNIDLAKAVSALIMKNSNYGIYHITNSGGCSWYDFAKEIALYYLGRDVEIEPISIRDLNLIAKRPRNSVLSNEKFYSLTGYKLRPWQEALKEYIQQCYKN